MIRVSLSCHVVHSSTYLANIAWFAQGFKVIVSISYHQIELVGTGKVLARCTPLTFVSMCHRRRLLGPAHWPETWRQQESWPTLREKYQLICVVFLKVFFWCDVTVLPKFVQTSRFLPILEPQLWKCLRPKSQIQKFIKKYYALLLNTQT